MLIFFGTGHAGGKFFAFPAKVRAAMRVALFYLKYMVYRDGMIKMSMRFMGTPEYVLPFILVDHLGGRRIMIFN